MSTKRKDVAKAYIKYRDQRTKERSWNNKNDAGCERKARRN